MTDGFFGQQGRSDDGTELDAIRFLIRQELAMVRTGIPVKVVAVHGGGVGPAPTVDVQPLVNQTDGQGNQTPHGVIFGVPVTRNQGGGNAVINDPKVGDVGKMVIADRDLSAIKANDGKQSNPGSFRRHNLADGVYIGAMLNPANPDQAVQFTDTGMVMFDKNGNKIEFASGSITITTATLRVTGDVVAGFGGQNISLLEHVHSGITRGGADTDPPVPGT
jgi:hypothetical protein